MLTPADRALLHSLQRQALEYFLDNQVPCGLFLDRQRNHGPRRPHGLCSTAATGMGCMALALASAPPYQLLMPSLAVHRVRAALEAALDRLPHDHGVVPHFVHSATGAVYGHDHFSTVETAWLAAGALWSAAFLRDAGLEQLASRFYERIDWDYWAGPEHGNDRRLLHHGKDRTGRFLGCTWDRLNGETVFMYVLAAGAASGRALPATAFHGLRTFYGTAAGLHFHSADLGLFVFQYGLDLLDLRRWRSSGPLDLHAEAAVATRANYLTCRAGADRFATYRRFWGLSAGDGPCTADRDAYRAYSPAGPVDGTAHLTATLASVSHEPETVLDNLREAEHDRRLAARGRYGFSNLNVDHDWVGRDLVGIDAGAAVLALDNVLEGDRVRNTFHGLPAVARGLACLGFVAPSDAEQPAVAVRQAS